MRAKQLGFSDKQVASAVGGCGVSDVLALRDRWQIRPSVKQVDTLAAEFPAQTNYLYLSYVGSEHDVLPLGQETLPAYKDSLYDSAFGKRPEEHGWTSPLKLAPKPKQVTTLDRDLGSFAPLLSSGSLVEIVERSAFLVLGSGCYRIGASVEFDWGCVSAIRTLRETGHRAMVINCNPETVSTDYDESDRLYFEELSLERVLDICDNEQPDKGVVISVGGQIANGLCMDMHASEFKVLGTCPTSIDKAEDRSKFSALCDANGIKQPKWRQLSMLAEVKDFIAEVGYPVLARPSYVLSGGGME